MTLRSCQSRDIVTLITRLMETAKKYYITTPIYYVNAKPHIGSAYTTIAADVVARFYKQQNYDVFFLAGTAEHGAKMTQAAEKAEKSPQEFVDEQSALFTKAWEKLSIEYTDFIRTTEKRHEDAVKLFFEKLKASGKVYEGEYEGLYCVGHEAFLKESELDENGLCPDHKVVPEHIKEKNWFFKLSEYGSILTDLIQKGDIRIEPENRRNEVLSFIEQGLEDISISRRNVEWAIPLPWDAEQTVYVWLDELFNYCSAVGYGVKEDKFRRYWPADVHVIGKDIIKFHCIIWPALLLAIGEEPPKRVFAHGFFTVNGQKMSKTLGNVIDPVELVDEYGSDAVRYLLLRDIPFGNDGDFSLERFQERYNADLANGLGNLVSRTLNMIDKFWPEYDGKGELSESLKTAIESETKAGQEALQNFQFEKYLYSTWKLIEKGDQVVEENKPWELAKAEKNDVLQAVLTDLYHLLRHINESIAPILPNTHEKLTQLLDNRPLQKPVEPLFARKEKA